jgi:hypothetical protein
MYAGDNQWLAKRYELLKSKTLMHRSGEDGLVRSAKLDRERHDIVDWPKKERDNYVFTEINTVVNAFHIAAIERMAEMAQAIGKQADADAYTARAKLAKSSLQEKLFDEKAGIYRDGIGTDHSSIHANFFPLAFDLIPKEKKAGVIEWLEGKKMQCSVYAAQYFMEGLFNNGSDNKAIDLITADGDRSWKHMVQSGTTISWEAWDLKYKSNQDWNHAWGAAPANLLPRFILGAQPSSPGWETASIRPCPGQLKFARGTVPTSRGPIEIDWTHESTFKISLNLPQDMTAEIALPAGKNSSGVLADGESIKAVRKGDRWIVSEPVSGSLTLEVE